MSIIIENLTKTYGEQKALDAISFETKPGEILGFLGPNGAGKSTTMKILTCYIPQTSGKASVCGYDVETNALEVRKMIGYLPELNPLYGDMYIKEYLLFSAQVQGITGKEAKSRMEEMMNKVGLMAERKKKIGQLSKGYKQRVGLAQAMLHNPKVLILDEPTSGLDPNQVVEIRELIREIGKDKTVLFSTHIMQEVEAICNRVVIINKGKIAANDSMENIRKKLSGDTIIQVGFKNSPEIVKLKEIAGVKSVTMAGNQFRIVSNRDLREEISILAVNNNWLVLSMTLEENSLENIFQNLTR